MAPEPNDVRVLIPRVRRALDGPAFGSAASPSSTYQDDALAAVIADAIAEIIFFTGGVFAHTLDVEARDDAYGAPEEWSVNPPLTEPETAIIAAQAALNQFFFTLKDQRTQETIRDEGQEWSYSVSATVVRDQMQYLIALRDKALEQIGADNAAIDTYTSFIAVRDATASWLIEPYVNGLGYGGQDMDMIR